ncbi:MAG TPA: ABC transporter permease [Gemmatimonadales bacterium]|nr:ABC transporter permease [Gemmatimonadales bacterium]
MGLVRVVLLRCRALFRRAATEQQLDEEIRLHLELETEKNRERGLAPDEARREALVRFGGVEVVKEAHRDGRGVRWIEDAFTDARVALRLLRRNPALSTAAVITLALGIGANTAIFSAVNAVILRPLPFPHAERLVMLSEDNPEKGWRRQTAAPANYLDWKERVHAFADVAAYTPGGGATMSGIDTPRRVRARAVTGNYFSVLQVRPEAGRVFTDAETWKGGTPVAIVSHRLAQDAFGSDGRAIGRSVSLDGARTEIVGVLPQDFTFAADSFDVWQPMAWDPQSRSQVFFRRAHWLRVVARLKPGVTPQAADAEFQTVVHQLQGEYPLTNKVMGADLVPLHDFLVGDVRTALLFLQAAVGLLLLIACANVANLLLAQALGREREAALRLALGAGRARLVRQAFTESLVLSAFGGLAGLALGWWGTRALAALQPAGMLPVASVRMDVSVLVAMVGLTTLTGLVFGLAPVFWSARRVPAEVLKEGERAGTSRRLRHWADMLVVGEVALALMLTVGAGLLVRSFWRLQHVEPGLDPHGVLAVGIDLPRGYDSAATQRTFFGALQERVRALPGVVDVAEALVAPFAGGGVGYTSDFHIAGRPANDYGTEIGHDYVTPDYFTALRIPLRAGRYFTPADRSGSVPVTIINEALAHRYFRGANPVGQRITFDKFPDSTSVWRTIVGVVGDVRQSGMAIEPLIEAYEPAAQQANSYMTLLVRTRGDVAALTPPIRRVMAELDANVVPDLVRPLERMQARSIADRRFIMWLLLIFAATGVLLALVGVYGVMTQLGRRRTREMGIRLALGARAPQVQWLVVRHGLQVVLVGLVLGVAGALAATQAIRALLFEVPPRDPTTFVTVSVMLALTALAASWLPALRASQADPAGVLRAE